VGFNDLGGSDEEDNWLVIRVSSEEEVLGTSLPWLGDGC
jgi:hypothetical protein